MFHPDDDALLNYLDDDGVSIEPEYYMPVMPLILVNGADGIGTGWSSQVNFTVVEMWRNVFLSKRLFAGDWVCYRRTDVKREVNHFRRYGTRTCVL